MNPYAQIKPCPDPTEEETAERFSTVELWWTGSLLGSQFRVWTRTPSYLAILIEEGSEFASRCAPGDTVVVNFHHEAMPYPGESMEASVRRIKKEVHGKLSGQVLAVLDVLNAYS
jgi:hypothetical protein